MLAQLPKWTTNPIKERGNPGVAQQVKRIPGSIGYVEFSYAIQNNLQMAMVQNKRGEFVMPSLESANKALSAVQFPDNFRVFEGDPSDGYPIAGLTWMMIYRDYDDTKVDAIKKWVEWVLTDGQELNASLDYTRIPPNVVQRVLQKVRSEVK